MTDLNHVALFAKVVEVGSFSAAARALGMPKATVSRNVAKLEASLGARLLHRTTRKVELTALGRAYHKEAEQGLSSLVPQASELRPPSRSRAERSASQPPSALARAA
ncbi:MAG: LysR family transcriptional regulator [Rhodobacteraceae bacterium]|nr:LysR family transcriptional regulator [Paracoccaceae bacterium]